jgi:hypothetical protein
LPIARIGPPPSRLSKGGQPNQHCRQTHSQGKKRNVPRPSRGHNSEY